MKFSCVLGHQALKTNPSVLWARSVGLSVEFSWLLGAQAGRHQRALRRYISAHRGEKKKKKTCFSEMVDYMKAEIQQ